VISTSSRARTACRATWGGVDHIGFAVEPDAIDPLVAAVEAAGGTTVMLTTDAAGGPVVFVTDLDGSLLQLG